MIVVVAQNSRSVAVWLGMHFLAVFPQNPFGVYGCSTGWNKSGPKVL